MRRTGRRDTEAELLVRRLLHGRGLRYRVDERPEADLRTRGDLVFRGARVAVFIDGCFWHGCPDHATRPKSNAEWWRTKLDANKERDERNTRALESRGWRVLRFWEHEDPESVADAIEREVRRLP